MTIHETSPADAVVMLSHALRTPQAGEFAGAEIGLYRLVEKLGDGGFGSVWRAEQSEPVQREVALKIIKLGMDTLEVMSRFEQERVALSMMDHPNIAKVLDAGATPEGRPFFVMELVRGVPITTYCFEKQLPLEQRLRLFTEVCAGVQHAHQKGIIHRDLKPSNILVAEVDGVPVPKIIDFGIAKATTDERLTDLTLRTRAEQMIGTPLYMSPEQAAGSADIDTRSDVYALGVVLYELLAGVPPFDVETLTRSGHEEMRRIIREVEPVRPSLKGRKGLKGQNGLSPTESLQSFSSSLSFDLDLITLKALSKDRTRRYESATAFAEDVQRFLNHEPVTARAPSWLYLTQRWMRRHRAAAVAVIVSGVAIVTGSSVAVWQAVRATRAQHEAERQIVDADAASRMITDVLGRFSSQRGQTSINRSALSDALLEKAQSYKGDLLRKGRMLVQIGKSMDDAQRIQAQQEGVALLEKYLPSDSTELWAARTTQADGLSNARHYLEAAALERRVLEWRTEHLGRLHEDTLVVALNLSRDLTLSKRTKDAITALEDLRQRLKEPGAPDMGSGMIWTEVRYAQALYEDHQAEKALAVSRAFTALRNSPDQKPYGEFLLGMIGWIHAAICFDLKLYDEASPSARDASLHLWPSDGPASGTSKQLFRTWVAIEQARKDTDAVIAVHLAFVGAHEQEFGRFDVKTSLVQQSCAQAMLAAGRFEDADKSSDGWLRNVTRANGCLDESSSAILGSRIDVLLAMKREADARQMCQEMLSNAKRLNATAATQPEYERMVKMVERLWAERKDRKD
ncbi:MAG: serine/threonine-protein kinase [Verrucomicrobiaceae bacterium]